MTSSKSQPFRGFPAGAEAVPIPAAMLTAVFPQVDDAAELVVSLYAAAAVQRQRRYPRLVEVDALRAERALIETLAAVCPGEEVEVAFRRGLDSAVARGTVLAVDARDANGERALITLNSDGDRRAAERIQRGELRRSVPWELVRRPAPEARGVTIYALYESVVGPITPGIGRELAEAEGLYSRQWIVEAFLESEELNKRNWRYVKRILERWDREGRSDEALGRSDRRRPDSRFEHLIRR